MPVAHEVVLRLNSTSTRQSTNYIFVCFLSFRYYCDNATTSYEDMINDKKCPSGFYCPAGLTSFDDKRDCEKSYYCPEATPEQVPCPTGTYNPDSNKGSITDCLACTAG